jgi:hypothetical protein
MCRYRLISVTCHLHWDLSCLLFPTAGERWPSLFNKNTRTTLFLMGSSSIITIWNAFLQQPIKVPWLVLLLTGRVNNLASYRYFNRFVSVGGGRQHVAVAMRFIAALLSSRNYRLGWSCFRVCVLDTQVWWDLSCGLELCSSFSAGRGGGRRNSVSRALWQSQHRVEFYFNLASLLFLAWTWGGGVT